MVVRMKAITPKKLDPSPIMDAMEEGMRDGGEILKAAAQRVTSTWSDPPEFTVHVELGKTARKGLQCTVTTEDKRWLWLDKGTGLWGPKHAKYPIPKVVGPGQKRLAFPSVFTPKSQPNSLRAGAGSSGGDTIVRIQVMHPGVEPRNFTKTIHKRYHSDFKKAVANAIAKWARKR